MGSSGKGNYTNPCLTMHQPWASLLVYGIKRVEGRSWPAPTRGISCEPNGRFSRIIFNFLCLKIIDFFTIELFRIFNLQKPFSSKLS